MQNSWKDKYKLLIFDSLDSTSSEAIRLAKANISQNHIILAKSQTAGRGQRGKNWVSETGNLYTSLLIKHNFSISILPQLSFVTALAVYDTIKYYLNPKDHNFIKLKWPNDVLIKDKKISGILIESINSYLIIGIGINITSNPANLDQPTTCLYNENRTSFSLEDILDVLMNNFEKYYSQWQDSGFEPIRKLWLEKAYRLNENITIRDDDSNISGKFIGISPNGQIIIQAPSEELSYHSNGVLIG